MDFKKIETFLLLAQRLSYSQTAKELYISQSSVTQHIKLLEDELGFLLFDRNRARVQLTREGEIMKKTFSAMQSRYEKGIREVLAIGEKETTISVSYPCGLYWMNMPELIKRFKQRHGIEVQIQIDNCNSGISAFTDGITDVIFANMMRLQHITHCVCVPTIKVGYNVVLTPDHPLAGKKQISPQDLYNDDVFCADGAPGDVCMIHLNQNIRSCGIDPNRLHIVPHRAEVISAAALDQGVGLTPDNIPFGEGGNLITVPFAAPDVSIRYACAIHQDASPLVRMFMKDAVEFLKKQQ